MFLEFLKYFSFYLADSQELNKFSESFQCLFPLIWRTTFPVSQMLFSLTKFFVLLNMTCSVFNFLLTYVIHVTLCVKFSKNIKFSVSNLALSKYWSSCNSATR